MVGLRAENLPGGGLYKSTDGGDHWNSSHGGFADDRFVGKIGIAVAPSNSNRLYAVVDDLGTAVAPSLRPHSRRTRRRRRKTLGGIYVSDDAGSHLAPYE